MSNLWKRNKEHDGFLSSLIGKRFNKESLLVVLNNHFKETVVISTMTVEKDGNDDDETDWRYYIETSEHDYCIFYLKMRCTGWDGSNIYITDVT